MNIKRFPFLKFLAPLTLGLGGAILLPSHSAIAAPSLTITPITWNVVGLDSNKPTVDGPDRFMAGARVCNVGDATATNVTARFVKDGGSSYINIVGASTLSIPSLPAGPTSRPPGNTGSTPSNCYDFYFNLALTRSSAAYSDLKFPSTRQQFHIEATATGLTTVSTTAGRELYVEKLVSQNRNAVDSITGPSTVYVGQTVQYTVNSHTAPGGYEQLSVLPLLPVFFQLISASSTYSTPSGSTNNTVYADACGWINDPTSPDYHDNGACNLPDNYTGGKAGDKITTVYTIKVLSTGSGSLTNIIYDYSGSSYHYNDDIGRGQNIFAVTALPPQADLSITKTDNQTTANPGRPINYTITVTNSGPSDVTGATVTDTVPSTITGVSWSCTASSGSSCGAASGTGNTINTTANLLSGGTATYTVTGTVSPTASGTLSNTASVAAPTGVTDPNTGNNSSTDTDTIAPTPDLTITKSHTGNFSQGGTGIYTITATNSGTASTTGLVTVTDTLPTGLTPTTATGTGWTCTISGQTVTCTRSDALAVSASYSAISLGVAVASNAPASVTNTATVGGGGEINTANNTGSDPTNINGVPDLTISKSHTGNFSQGGTGTYTITASNSGRAATSGTVTVSDTVPTGLTPTTATGTGWTCTVSGQTVTCTRSDALAAGSSYPAISLSINVASNAPSSITNTATIGGGGETNTANNTGSDPTTINGVPDLTITKTHTGGFLQGTTGSYTITATNSGGAATSGTVTVRDTLPTGLTPTLATGTGWTCTTLGQSVTCTRSDVLATNASYPAISLSVLVAANAPASVTNTATVSGGGQTNTTNDTANDQTTIGAVSDLALTKSHTGDFIRGATGSYSIVVRNSGAIATNGIVTVNDTLPSGLTLNGTPSGTGWTCTTSSTTAFSCTRVDILNAGSNYPAITVNVNVDQIATNSVTNTATVSGGGETNTSNNSSSDLTNIVSSADLSLTKTASSTNPKVGQNVTFTVTVSNAGPSTATSVVVADVLPTGLSFVSATPSQGTYNNSTGIWTVGSIASGVNASLQVTATLTSNNAVTNTAEVTASDQPDPDSTPNNHVATEDDQASVTVGSGISKLLMVKRITAIIPVNGTNTTSFVDDPNTTDDNSPDWFTGYLKGAINGGAAKPGDEVEYTIYFLSDGGRATRNVNMCDLIPANTTFSPDAFGSGLGIQRATGSATAVNLTNTGTDSDGGQFVAAGSSLPTGVSCGASNTNGAVIVSLGDLPNATGSGSPSNSYGFIRFRVKVK